MTNEMLLRERLRSVWKHLIDRCTNPKFKQYKDYGGSGICYDSSWNDFNVFVEDAIKIQGWNKDKFLAKEIELDKDIKYRGNNKYSLETCLWVTRDMNMILRPTQLRPFYAYNVNTNKIAYGESPYIFSRVYGANTSTIYNVLSLTNRKKSTNGWYLWFIDEVPPTIHIYYGRYLNDNTWYFGINKQQLSLHMGLSRTRVANLLGNKEKASNTSFEVKQETVDLIKLTKGLETKFLTNQWGKLEQEWIDAQLALI